MKNKSYLQYMWPIFGIIVMLFSAKILYNEFHNPHSQLSHLDWHDLIQRIENIPHIRWIGAAICTVLAYTALAEYDKLALKHLNKKITWWFIAATSFSAYSISHSIGASVFSGAAIRYRAYSTKKVSGSEVALLVAFSSFTFVLGVVILLAFIFSFKPSMALMLEPELSKILKHNISDYYIIKGAFIAGIILFVLIAIYILGSWFHCSPFDIGKNITIVYPRLNIVMKQMIIGPLELLASSGIIYFMLSPSTHLSYISVVLAFLLCFTLGILSNAPGGGLGIFELSFISLFPTVDPRNILVALIVFRFFYIIIPLLISIIFIGIFEFFEYKRRQSIYCD